MWSVLTLKPACLRATAAATFSERAISRSPSSCRASNDEPGGTTWSCGTSVEPSGRMNAKSLSAHVARRIETSTKYSAPGPGACGFSPSTVTFEATGVALLGT